METDIIGSILEYAPAVALMAVVVWRLLSQQDRLIDQLIQLSTICAGMCNEDDDDD